MTTLQELYELERKRADMCEGIIMELRHRNAVLESRLTQLERDERHAWERVATVIQERNALKVERRELRKALAKAKEAAA